MPLTDVPVLEESVEIAAPPARVWDLVKDPREMTRWSPQTWKSFLRGGGQPAEGSRFVNLNRKGPLMWPTRSKIVRFEPEREIAFRIEENWVVWSFRLEAIPAGGTRLVQRRETPDGISEYSQNLTDTYLGGQEAFTEILHAGMEQTLAAIRAAA